MTSVLMAILIVVMAVCTLGGVRYDSLKNSFFTKSDSIFLRSFWCMIIILVHIPASYQNKLQDMMGSFAYIGVTFFFMTSAYGLKYSVKNKEKYLEKFWKERLPVLLLPALIANAFNVIMSKLAWGGNISIFSFIHINGWVKVLLLFYLFFWLVYKIMPESCGILRDVVICSFVVACSLTDRLTDLKVTSIWIVEPLGFVYGIIAANHTDKILKLASKKWIFKSVVLMVASLGIGIVYLKYKSLVFIGDYLIKVLLGIAITALICHLTIRFRVGNKINYFIGNISYEIYLLHGGVFALLAFVDSNRMMNSGLYILVAIMMTVFFSILLNKSSNYLRKLIFRQ